MMKVCVTGGAGFIGSHLASRLCDLGYEVVIIDDLSSGKRENIPPSARFVEGSILDADLVEAAISGCSCVFHTAAIASVQRSIDEPIYCTRVNVEGTVNVIESAARNNARVVFSSSSAVYGDAAHLPISEDSATNPLSPYGVHKLTAEKLLFSYAATRNLSSVALRYFNVFGPKQDPNGEYAAVISKFVTRALSDIPMTIFGEGDQTRDFIFVDDIVDANIAALQAERVNAEVCNIGFGKAWSVRELAEKIVTLANSKSAIQHAPPRTGEILHSFGTTERAEKVLGFRAKTSLEAGLEKTIAYWRSIAVVAGTT